MSAFIKADDETLPDAFARARQSFGGGGMSVLIVLPDGSGFRATPNDDGETVYSERLDEGEMVAAIMSLYGLSVLRVQ